MELQQARSKICMAWMPHDKMHGLISVIKPKLPRLKPRVYRTRGVDLPTNELPEGCARSLHTFLEGVQNFGQGLKIIVSRLCTLNNWDRKHDTARKVRNIRVVESFGQGQKKLLNPPGQGVSERFDK